MISADLKTYMSKYGTDILQFSGEIGIEELNGLAKIALEKGEPIKIKQGGYIVNSQIEKSADSPVLPEVPLDPFERIRQANLNRSGIISSHFQRPDFEKH